MTDHNLPTGERPEHAVELEEVLVYPSPLCARWATGGVAANAWLTITAAWPASRSSGLASAVNAMIGLTRTVGSTRIR
jgi:hypothetical protein